VTSGLEGAWSVNPIAWTSQFLDNLFGYDWVKTKSPAGAVQWIPANNEAANLVPDAHNPSKRHAPIMLTTDLALKEDPAYRAVSLRFKEDPQQYALAFAKAWYKLTHRDLGPRSNYLGSEVPDEVLIWQDPIPEADYDTVNDRDVKRLKKRIQETDLTSAQLAHVAWSSAASFRRTDSRGGANGGRIRLAPQKDWQANNPALLAKVLPELEAIQEAFNSRSGKRQVSMADLIVLGGAVAIEEAAKAAGYDIDVPFTPGRTDATQALTDVQSFAVLEPKADGFRNYFSSAENTRSPAEMLVERADMLALTIPEMSVLVGGMRVLGVNTNNDSHGVFTQTPGHLNNHFFVNLLDMSTAWHKSSKSAGIYEGHDRSTGQLKWTATPVDLVFGSHAELRAVAEVYAAADAEEKFLNDFVSAWTKVMNLDRR